MTEPEKKVAPQDLMTRSAILAMELSGRAIKELMDEEDAGIDWDLVAKCADAAANCGITMMAMRNDHEMRQKRDATRWQKIDACTHKALDNSSAFDITPNGAICRACGVDADSWRKRSEFLEQQSAQGEEGKGEETEEEATE